MAGAILDMITSPVTVVTARAGDAINGMTVAWLAQVSYYPPMAAVAIAPQRYTHELIKKSGKFVINVLSEGQKELGRHFGSFSGRGRNKFENLDFHSTSSGIPILKDIYACLECNVVSTHAVGDHSLFIGEVIRHQATGGKRPLIFRTEDYF
ncbi:MAG TPA: flavin reductase family protein [Candidatus Omnitrophota bacterium]|nr:flavin reductase family protein [Candidatus Omnitrophota bacterium]